jgi:NADH pyrophosphatase NudC (nudix superfamily)
MAFPTAFHSYLPRTHCVPTHTYGIVLVSNKGNILVVKGRLSEKWGFPKGHGNNGEKPLDAALRELKEEAGIDVGQVTYLASQPWPFPASLMIGCLAEARTSTLRVDESELEDARWFTRAEAAQLLAGTHPAGLVAPQPLAIAHHILRHWVEHGG